MKSVQIRFFEELNDFLPVKNRKVEFSREFFGRQSVKDLIEAIGVPHIEVDLILVNGSSVNFSYIIEDKDQISVYPVFESFDITEVQKLRPKPLRRNKFILDCHLGKLARYLRMIGSDSEYLAISDVDMIIRISQDQKRTILTRSSKLLKRKIITHGYWIRNANIKLQLEEVISRFHLKNEIKEFTRCLECNTFLVEVEKKSVLDRLPEKVKLFYGEFKECKVCKKLYWKGYHYLKMKKFIEEIKFSDSISSTPTNSC